MIMKRKSRYVLCETSSEIGMDDKRNFLSLFDSMLDFMGSQRYAKANPKFMLSSGKLFILRVNRESERDTILSMAFIKSVNGHKLGIRTIKASGTIRTLNEIIRRTKSLNQ